MADSLATTEKPEMRRATVAQPSLADLGTYVNACTDMDGEVLGEYIERNWDNAVGNALGLMFLVKEMKRRFKLLDRKKQVDGTYKKIRGFTSFDGWFTSFTGKSRRLAYYLLETEEKKNERNTKRRTTTTKPMPVAIVPVAAVAPSPFLARCEEAKEKLTEIQRQINTSYRAQSLKPLEAQINPIITEAFHEFLALVAPEGYEIMRGDSGGFYLSEKDEDEPEPLSPEAKRSASAKKAGATRAANKAKRAAQATTKEKQQLKCTLHGCTNQEEAKERITTCERIGGQGAGDGRVVEKKQVLCDTCFDLMKSVGLAHEPEGDDLGTCESCGDAPATEVVGITEFNSGGYKYCAKCADDNRKDNRKYLIRQMGVAKVMGKMCSLKSLADLGGKSMDFGDGDVRTYPTVGDYLARLKEKFLGNPRYDQTVVVEYVARLEAKKVSAGDR